MALNNNNDEMRLLNWNANGIKRQTNSFIHFLNENKIKIACITETHLLPGEKFKVNGYAIYRNDRLTHCASGGVAILIHKSTKHFQIDIPSDKMLETVAIVTYVNNEETVIVCAYKPPNYPFPQDIYKNIFQKHSKVLIIGDLNSKNIAWKCNSTSSHGRKLLQLITNNNLDIHAPNEPTHYPYNNRITPDILDIIISQGINFPIYQTVVPDLDSDHNPVICSFQGKISIQDNINKTINKNINWSKFRDLISQNLEFPNSIKNDNQLELEITRLNNAIQKV